MEQEICIIDQQCFVCGHKLSSNGKSVLGTTRHSNKKIYQFLETFVEHNFYEILETSSSSTAEICEKCLESLEEYDNICMRAARIQEHFASTFNENQEKIRSKAKDFLKCHSCSGLFGSASDLKDHQCIAEDDDTPFIEEDIYVSEESNEQYPVTAKTLQSKHAYTCNQCFEQFEKKRDYQAHKKLAHLPEDAEIFSCPECKDQQFGTDLELKLHLTTSHPSNPEEQNFECPACQKTFSTKSLLNRHFGIHSAKTDRPHVCEICGKTFFHHSSFHQHIKMHFDTREFSCSICSKSFRSMSHLNRHIKIHTKQKDHECPDCGSRFAERYNLTAHIKTHQGLSRKKKPQAVIE